MTQIPAYMKPLTPYLQGAPRSNGEVDMTCPLHEDGKRSASLNVKQGVWNCFKGCGGGPVKGLLARRSEWIPPGGQQAETDPAKDQEPLPSRAEIRRWTRTLLNDQATLDNFVGRRGLFSDTIEQFQLGWNPDRASYTIPVYEGSKLITVRFYNMGQRSGRKFYSLTGRGSAYLYPLEVFAEDPEEIIICEGELDALISIQAGFPAITRTGAAGVWSKSWNEWFKGRIVYLCHDCDDAGVDANVKVGRALRNVAADVRVIRLPYPITKDHGKDLTDFWVDHAGTMNEKARLLFEQMKYDAAPFDPDLIKPHEIEPGDVDAIEAFNAALAENPNDHRSAYGAGVAAEASGNVDMALNFYNQACAGQNNSTYAESRDRVKGFTGRVPKA